MPSKLNQYLEMARLSAKELKKRGHYIPGQTGWSTVGDAFKHVVKKLKAKGIDKKDVSEKEMIKMMDDAIAVHGHFAHADWKQEVKNLYWNWKGKE